MATKRSDWGVTEVIVRYYSGEDSYEIELDPAEIDVLVFNWAHFRKINGVVGRPIRPENHIRPDGSSRDGRETPEEVARRSGLKGPPKRVGRRTAGTSGEPLCYHRGDCEWVCMDPTHDHPPDEEGPAN